MNPAELTPAKLAGILETIGRSRYPRLDLPNVAAAQELTLQQLQHILARFGYPDQSKLLAAASKQRDLATLARINHRPPETAESSPDAGKPLLVPIGDVIPDPQNPRTELTEIEDLAESIDVLGMMLEPIVVRRHPSTGKFVIVAGHRRRAAAELLGWKTVPVTIAEIRSGMVLIAMLIENGQRVDLDPIEEARALRHLMMYGAADNPTTPLERRLSHSEVAQFVGRSQAHVSGRLALLELSKADQDAIRAGTMAIQVGIEEGRRNAGTYTPSMTGKKSAAHFTMHHQLADIARALCRHNGHSAKTPGGLLGGVACGRCWESTIRSDESDKIAARAAAREEVTP